MYDKRAKQDALDPMPGEMSVDDFATELGYPSGTGLHDPDKCQYCPSPCSQAEAIRLAGATPRETGLTPSRCAHGKVRPRGRRRCCRRPRGRGGRERPWTREDPPGEPAGPPDPASSRRGCRRSCPTTRRRSRRSSPTWAQQRRAQGGVSRPKAGRRPSPTLRRPAAPPRLEGAFGAAAACAATGLARSTYYYQLDALTSPSAPPDGTAGEVERAFRVDGNSSRGYRFVREVVSRRRGRPVSEKVVRRLMRGLGLRVCYARRGRYSSYAGEIDAPAPNLLLRADGTHDFSAGRPNEAWVSDVTEFRLPDDGRKVYLSPVVDLFDGKPVGWAVGTSPDARLTESSLGWRARRSGRGRRPSRTHRPRLPLPLARVEGHMRAPRAGQVDVAQAPAPTTPPARVLRQPEERVLPRAGLVGMDGGGLHGAAGRWMAAYSTVRLKAFREGGRTVYDTIDNRRRRLGLAA